MGSDESGHSACAAREQAEQGADEDGRREHASDLPWAMHRAHHRNAPAAIPPSAGVIRATPRRQRLSRGHQAAGMASGQALGERHAFMEGDCGEPPGRADQRRPKQQPAIVTVVARRVRCRLRVRGCFGDFRRVFHGLRMLSKANCSETIPWTWLAYRFYFR